MEDVIYGKFRLVAAVGRDRCLECLRCGCEFQADKHPKVLMFCPETKRYYTQCPLCNSRERPE